ncbi:MAG: type II toxin-antitoxin system VapC family toxin [Spirochaetales bacterium]|jgi:predicted nucleic acid-binding protein|nr:type II toxin-antitoxin system VapC family toxin [Spirochaetales bacterium]
MNGKTLVLDTNAVIKLLDNEECSRFLDAHFPGNVRCVSIITQIELLAYPDITREADTLIRSFLADIPIITIDGDIAETAIQIRRSKPLIKLPDAVIAATAIDFNAVLITSDVDLLRLRWQGLAAVSIGI